MYLMSFMTLGIFWGRPAERSTIHFLERSDRHLTWIPHPDFLFPVDPAHAVLDEAARRVRLVVPGRPLLAYWFNILLLGPTVYWSWSPTPCATSFLKADTPPEVAGRGSGGGSSSPRPSTPFGALLCVFNTCLSIAFIVAPCSSTTWSPLGSGTGAAGAAPADWGWKPGRGRHLFHRGGPSEAPPARTHALPPCASRTLPQPPSPCLRAGALRGRRARPPRRTGSR